MFMLGLAAFGIIKESLNGDSIEYDLPLVVLLFCASIFTWLKGFKLEVRDGMLIYRNGLYQTYKMTLSEIKCIKSVAYVWGRDGRKKQTGIPRAMIVFKEPRRNGIIINTKVFSLQDLRRLHDLITDKTDIPKRTRRRK